MPSTFRIPKADLTTLRGRLVAAYSLRTYGQAADAFSAGERRVLEYTEARTATPPTVTDQMVADLIGDLGVKAVVELTEMVALENLRSRFNCAASLASQGFGDVCELPLATAPGGGGRISS